MALVTMIIYLVENSFYIKVLYKNISQEPLMLTIDSIKFIKCNPTLDANVKYKLIISFKGWNEVFMILQ